MSILNHQKLDFKRQSWSFKERRVKDTLDFFGPSNDGSERILATGLEGFEERMISGECSVTGTVGDYNYSDWKPDGAYYHSFNKVFCFEVLEHLLNPLLFLERLKLFTTDDAKFYFSFPSGSRPRFLWTPAHFHEYKKDRVEALFEIAQYRIVKQGMSRIIWEYPKDYLKGIRPLLRFLSPLRLRFYLLHKKN